MRSGVKSARVGAQTFNLILTYTAVHYFTLLYALHWCIALEHSIVILLQCQCFELFASAVVATRILCTDNILYTILSRTTCIYRWRLFLYLCICNAGLAIGSAIYGWWVPYDVPVSIWELERDHPVPLEPIADPKYTHLTKLGSRLGGDWPVLMLTFYCTSTLMICARPPYFVRVLDS